MVDKRAAVRHAKASIETEMMLKLTEANKRSREVEEALKEELNTSLIKKGKEIEKINSDLSNALDRLQLLRSKDRANTITSVTCPEPAVEFYREDGEFLAREAARAETVLKERDFYYDQYERARRKLRDQQRGDGSQ